MELGVSEGARAERGGGLSCLQICFVLDFFPPQNWEALNLI